MDKTFKDAGITPSSTSQYWEPQRSYERKLVLLMSKDTSECRCMIGPPEWHVVSQHTDFYRFPCQYHQPFEQQRGKPQPLPRLRTKQEREALTQRSKSRLCQHGNDRGQSLLPPGRQPPKPSRKKKDQKSRGCPADAVDACQPWARHQTMPMFQARKTRKKRSRQRRGRRQGQQVQGEHPLRSNPMVCEAPCRARTWRHP